MDKFKAKLNKQKKSIYLSIYPSIHPSIHPSIYLSITSKVSCRPNAFSTSSHQFCCNKQLGIYVLFYTVNSVQP